MTDREIIVSFRSTTCLCGKPKQEMQSFCYKCYKSLPLPMRNNLYRRFGSGYEQAYEAACEKLTAFSA